MQSLDTYLSQARNLANQDAPLSLDATWGQGKTTFGGMSAALAVAALEQQQPNGQLRTLNVNFCGALLTECPLAIDSQPLRIGRSLSHYQASVQQQDACPTHVTACYALSRDSDIQIAAPAKKPGEPSDGQRLPFIPNITPAFMQHLKFSYVDGQFPFSSSPHHHVHGWMGLAQGTGLMTDAHLVALIDAWPPTTYQKLKAPAPCATITWNIQFITPLESLSTPLRSDDWLYYEADTHAASDGYTHAEARIYTSQGELLALSRQLIAIYDKRK